MHPVRQLRGLHGAWLLQYLESMKCRGTHGNDVFSCGELHRSSLRLLGMQPIDWNHSWLDGADVSASGWGSGAPQFQSHPGLTFQSCSRYQLNQLGNKAASESTFKKSNNCGVSNTRFYFTFYSLDAWISVGIRYRDGRIKRYNPPSSKHLLPYSIIFIIYTNRYFASFVLLTMCT